MGFEHCFHVCLMKLWARKNAFHSLYSPHPPIGVSAAAFMYSHLGIYSHSNLPGERGGEDRGPPPKSSADGEEGEGEAGEEGEEPGDVGEEQEEGEEGEPGARSLVDV